MFGDHHNEQQLYHSIATVGTLLLEIGEVGKKFYLPKQESSDLGITSETESGSEMESPSQSLDITSTENTPVDKSKDVQPAAPIEAEATSAISEVSEQLSEVSVSDTSVQKDSEIDQTADAVKSDSVQLATDSGVSVSSSLTIQRGERTVSTSSSSKIDIEWSISFEQFLASMLTESAIVSYFEHQYNVTDAVARMRNRRLLMRQTSPPFEEKKQ